MNKVLIVTALVLSTGYASAGANDPGYNTYRRVVLGDSTVASQPGSSNKVGENTVVLGSYGRYLRFLGMSDRDAAVAAERTGELATVVAVGAGSPSLTGYALYRRAVLGHSETGSVRDRGTETGRVVMTDSAGR